MRRNGPGACRNKPEWTTVTARSPAAASEAVSIHDPEDRPSLLAMLTPTRLIFAGAVAATMWWFSPNPIVLCVGWSALVGVGLAMHPANARVLYGADVSKGLTGLGVPAAILALAMYAAWSFLNPLLFFVSAAVLGFVFFVVLGLFVFVLFADRAPAQQHEGGRR